MYNKGLIRLVKIRPITSQKIFRTALFVLGSVLTASLIVGVYTTPSSALDVSSVAIPALVSFLVGGWGENIPIWVLHFMGRSHPEGNNLDPYSSIIETAEEECKDVAERLQLIRIESDGDPFDALSEILQRGKEARESDPVEQTISIIEQKIKAKQYIDQTRTAEMDVIEVRGNKIVVRAQESDEQPGKGLLFDLSIESITRHNGESISDRENVAVAEFVEQRGSGILIMEIRDVKEDAVENKQSLLNTLMNRGPEVQVRSIGKDQIDWENMEQMHEYLKQCKNTGKLP